MKKVAPKKVEDLYRFLLESTSDPIIIYDRDGAVHHVNPAFEQVFGWTLKEISGRRLDLVPAADRSQARAFIERLSRDGEAAADGARCLTRDGRIVDVQLRARLIPGEKDRIAGTLLMMPGAVGRDERAIAPAALNRRIADMVDLLPDAVMAIDLEGKVIAWNRAIEAMTGVKAADMLGRGDYEYALPFYGERRPLLIDLVLRPQEEFAQRYAHIRRSGEVLSGETYTPHLKSGSYHVLASAAPLRDERGSLVGAIEIIRENTERKKMERALEESQRRMADIIDFLPDAVIVIDREGKVIAWNRAIEEMTGVKAADMLGKGDYEYAMPFYGERRPILVDLVLLPREEFERQYTHIQRVGEVLFGESYTPHLKSGAHHLSASASALRDSQGNLVGAIEVIRDSTERKRTMTELEQSRRAAEAATMAKSEFLANMSHEIRTPMNGVIGMTSLLLDTALNDEQREYVETIRRSGDALLAIINDILDFSKIEAGKLELELHPFDLRECVETATDLVAYRASEQGLELLTNIELDVPAAVVGDVTRLRQILANLLSNAVKFTSAGEIEVGIRKEAGESSAGSECRLHFSVRDSGIGIPPERADRLFQVFSQVDASTTRKFGGTGLGLAICKRLAGLMGGDIWAESAGHGQGTTFHFALPFQVASPIRSNRQHGAHIALRQKTLLVVDDNATNRLIVNRMARSWGMQTVECASGPEALQQIDAGLKADAAVLDVQMPEMDGITLSGELRRRRSEQELPFVVLSSLGQKLPLPPGVNAAAYLHKPVKPSQLYDALIAAFDAQGERPDLPAAPGEAFDAEMGQRHPLHILVAEDHAVNQKVMRLMLERLGYRADLASDGLEAVRSFKRQDYDVVLMDIQMPEMNGVEATQRLRADLPAERQPRIIALTANALGGERDEYLAAGMDDYLSKPVNVSALRAALEKCMPIGAPQTIGGGQPADGADRPAAIDIPTLKEYFPYEGEAISMVIDLAEEFLADTSARLVELEAALQQSDAAAVNMIAHAVKGASMAFGAMEFSALCKELEVIGASGNLSGASERCTQARAEYERVRVELPAILRAMQ